MAFPQNGKTVAVTAEKEVEIQDNNVSAARQIALSLAVRDAVEKGYGTFIQLEELPEARRILTQAAAGLKYKILAEQKRKTKYWVKIQADVMVPAEYIGDTKEERETIGKTMKNFVQKYPQGEINWGAGFILAYGKGEITATGPNAEDLAARAAEVDARAKLLEMVNEIPLDERHKTRDEPRLSFALEGFVQGSEVVARSKIGTIVQVTVQAPLRGVKGLTMTLYGYYVPEPPPQPSVAQQEPSEQKPPEVAEKPAEPVEPEKPESFTGVIIDARAVPANAAVFPKIRDDSEREVYNVGSVNKEDLQKRGMASYAVVSRDAPITHLFPRANVIPVSYVLEGGSGGTTSVRQGSSPLLLPAVKTMGPLETTLIVTRHNADQLLTNKNALQECRVVIVLSEDSQVQSARVSPHAF